MKINPSVNNIFRAWGARNPSIRVYWRMKIFWEDLIRSTTSVSRSVYWSWSQQAPLSFPPTKNTSRIPRPTDHNIFTPTSLYTKPEATHAIYNDIIHMKKSQLTKQSPGNTSSYYLRLLPTFMTPILSSMLTHLSRYIQEKKCTGPTNSSCRTILSIRTAPLVHCDHSWKTEMPKFR